MGCLVGQRVRQLLVPFVVFAVVVVAGKLIAARYVSVDNPPAGFAQGLASIVLTPMNSPSAFLWYLQVLAVYYLVVPWLLKWSARWSPAGLLVAGIALQGAALPTLLNLNFVVEYLPFFAAGLLIGQHWQWLQRGVLAHRAWSLYAPIFAIALVSSQMWAPWPKWLVGSLAIPFVLTVHQRVPATASRWLAFLGSQTLSIYLMNTISIGVAKAMLKPVVPYQGHYFLIYLVGLTAAGLLLPIAIKHLLVGWRPGLRHYL